MLVPSPIQHPPLGTSSSLVSIKNVRSVNYIRGTSLSALFTHNNVPFGPSVSQSDAGKTTFLFKIKHIDSIMMERDFVVYQETTKCRTIVLIVIKITVSQ